jgi:hypothetical protein
MCPPPLLLGGGGCLLFFNKGVTISDENKGSDNVRRKTLRQWIPKIKNKRNGNTTQYSATPILTTDNKIHRTQITSIISWYLKPRNPSERSSKLGLGNEPSILF